MSVITVGDFDGVHLGHRTLLRAVTDRAKELGTESLVLTFDRNTKNALKGNNAGCLTDTRERRELLQAEGIDRVAVVSFDESFCNMSEKDFLEYLRVCYGCTDLFGGPDFRFGKGGAGFLTDGLVLEGIRQHVVALKTDLVKISSTSIRTALADGLIERANTWLGHPYSITGTVVEGKHLGRTIGFPTINVVPGEGKILPRNGVYITQTIAEGRVYASMTNVGTRPTVEDNAAKNAETHLLNGDGDFYGKIVTVRFLSRLRDEKHFTDIGALMRQLRIDREDAFRRHKEWAFM